MEQKSRYRRLAGAIFLAIRVLFFFAVDCLRDLTSLIKLKTIRRACSLRNDARKPTTYHEWYAEQGRLDRSRDVEGWASFPDHPDYKFRALQDFRKNIATSQARDDYHYLCSRLRAQLDRNICTILSPRLYRKSLIRTKQLIHDYVDDMVECIWYMAKWRGRPLNQWSEKSTVLHEVKDRVFGRTSLVLTGGAALSLCHIGVVKTLFEQQLLPQIITGISSGSLVASLVGISTDHELRQLTKLKNINLKAFADREKGQDQGWWIQRQISAFQRRRIRLLTTGHVFDIGVLRKFAQDNLGEITFEEAYEKTGRVLNIMIAMSDVHGTPQLLNHITSPYVIVWSAVVASIATSHHMYAMTRLLCKTADGKIEGYRAPDALSAHSQSAYPDEVRPPLQRLAELFNVNHFVISQTRPYVFPFLWTMRLTEDTPALGRLVRIIFREVLFWLTRPKLIGMPVPFIHRILLDELVPSSAQSFSKLHILPKLGLRDMADMFETPSPEALKKWSRIGEESTWPYLCQLQIRCKIELEMDRAYASIKRRQDSMIM